MVKAVDFDSRGPLFKLNRSSSRKHRSVAIKSSYFRIASTLQAVAVMQHHKESQKWKS